MNIFVTDKSPINSAINLDNKRVFHMQRESLEMLAVFVKRQTGEYPIKFPYWGPRTEYAHELYSHPVTEWVCRSSANVMWVLDHLQAKISESVFRGLPRSVTAEDYHSVLRALWDLGIPTQKQKITPFRNSSRFKHLDVITAYRITMIDKWENTDRREVSFGVRGKPLWYDEAKKLLQNQKTQKNEYYSLENQRRKSSDKRHVNRASSKSLPIRYE